jgi:thiol:disulfide interchange protein
VNTRLAAGETLFLDFKASWCSTCAAQERRITALKAANPAYEENMTFINVDWDLHGRSDLVTRLGVPRRSTLVVLKGNQRLGMVVADTSEASIKQLLDLGLSAATA